MKLKDKLNAAKDALVGSIDEFGQTVDLDAEEYAHFYGATYKNFLYYIKKCIFTQVSEGIEEEELKVEIPIASIKDKEIIFDTSEFGAKERFDMTILKNLLYKARIHYEISEDNDKLILTPDNTERLSDRVENIIENKDEYIDNALEAAAAGVEKVKGYVSLGSQKAREGTKKLLRNLADYADKNL